MGLPMHGVRNNFSRQLEEGICFCAWYPFLMEKTHRRRSWYSASRQNTTPAELRGDAESALSESLQDS